MLISAFFEHLFHEIRIFTRNAIKSAPDVIFQFCFHLQQAKGLHIIYRGYGAGNIYKKFFKKVLAPSEEHDKKILAPYATHAKKFVPRMLKKFIYLSGKVLLFETLNFQKEINSKRYTSLNKQSY